MNHTPLIQQYLHDEKKVSPQLIAMIEKILTSDEPTTRQAYIDCMFLSGVLAKEEHRKHDVRYCTSQILQVMQDANHVLYKNVEWVQPVVSKELIAFLEYGIALSERMYHFETFAMIIYQALFMVIVGGLMVCVFTQDVQRTVQLISLFIFIDTAIMIFMRRRKGRDISRKSNLRNTNSVLQKYTLFYKIEEK